MSCIFLVIWVRPINFFKRLPTFYRTKNVSLREDNEGYSYKCESTFSALYDLSLRVMFCLARYRQVASVSFEVSTTCGVVTVEQGKTIVRKIGLSESR